ncbi:hypothetical protein [Acetobacter thailandicus]|uniref:hypothetical protein n=1 Tax=Acetobacter thailandicus TaxID=1502842 RepID=UPI001BAE2D52|nr:hypothetical protein [Acetobacter thailandicus]MBS0959756.1 hypothetical protein [Acetobacter thailandicus]
MSETGKTSEKTQVFFDSNRLRESDNFVLQGLLVAAERNFTAGRRSRMQKHSTMCSDSRDRSSPVTDDCLHIEMMLLERHHLQLLACQRTSGRQFLDFLRPFDLQTLDDLGSVRRKLYDQIHAQPLSSLDKVLELQNLYQEHYLWQLQMQIVDIGARLKTTVPRYGFSEYSAIRATIIEEGCRYIGRALHIAARLSLHHPDIPISWERCLSVFQTGRRGIDPFSTVDDYVMEPSTPSRMLRKRKREAREKWEAINKLDDNEKREAIEQLDASEKWEASKREKNHLSKRTLDEIKKHFGPVAHILAAMDVLACRAYLPIHPTDNVWPPYRPTCETDPGCLTAGRSFMDDPRDEGMTRATLGYALWFQDWGLKKPSAPGSRTLLEGSDIVWLLSDLSLPEVIVHELDVMRDGESVARQDPVYGYTYDPHLYDDRTEDAADKAGMAAPEPASPDASPVATDMGEKEKPAHMKSPALILPPLPKKILDILRDYEPQNSKPE